MPQRTLFPRRHLQLLHDDQRKIDVARIQNPPVAAQHLDRMRLRRLPVRLRQPLQTEAVAVVPVLLLLRHLVAIAILYNAKQKKSTTAPPQLEISTPLTSLMGLLRIRQQLVEQFRTSLRGQLDVAAGGALDVGDVDHLRRSLGRVPLVLRFRCVRLFRRLYFGLEGQLARVYERGVSAGAL